MANPAPPPQRETPKPAHRYFTAPYTPGQAHARHLSSPRHTTHIALRPRGYWVVPVLGIHGLDAETRWKTQYNARRSVVGVEEEEEEAAEEENGSESEGEGESAGGSGGGGSGGSVGSVDAEGTEDSDNTLCASDGEELEGVAAGAGETEDDDEQTLFEMEL